MSRPQDFENHWQDKLVRALEARIGQAAAREITAGGESLSDSSTPRERQAWTCQVLEKMENVAELETRQEILAACHCQYPVEDLGDIKAAYQASGQVETALEMLQARFETFLREGLGLEEELVAEVVRRGWGLAGVRQGQRVIATKIPKSGYLRDYFKESDPLQKRRLYCHCPRVRNMVGEEPALPGEYCYCGAGYYQGIWEEILGQPVKVEILQSVMAGDEVCQVAVHLP